MFCPKCSKINPDANEKCSGCGALLHEETEVAVPAKKKGIKLLITAVVIIAIVVVAVLMLNGCAPVNIENDKVSF